MNKKISGTILLLAVLSLAGCSSGNEMPTEAESSVVSDITSESVQDEAVGSEATKEVTSASEIDPTSEYASSDTNTDDSLFSLFGDIGTYETYDIADINETEENKMNPGFSVYIVEYNGSDYMLDINTIRFVLDSDGNVISEKDSDSRLKVYDYVYDYKLSEYEYIGSGDMLGTRPEAKLYLTKDDNILAVFPCDDIDQYTDAEEILAEYSRDMIFSAFAFIKIED